MINPRAGQLETLSHCLDEIPAQFKSNVLAFSGGLDSCVLLHLLVNHFPALQIRLWHVNHGLQNEAKQMSDFCQKKANDYKLELEVSELNLGSIESNVEAIARKARYDLFAKGLTRGECLLTAHHADDQVETFLLNVLRGSGSAGLRGIASSKAIGRTTVFRPLLRVNRAVLLDYAKQHQLEWFDDPSNASDQFSRNYLRHHITPAFKTRWPGYQSSFNTVCELQAETQSMLDELALIDYKNASSHENKNTSSALTVKTIQSLSFARQKNVIRYWLKNNNCDSLPGARLDTLINQLGAGDDKSPIIQGSHYELRIFAGRLYIVEPITAQPHRKVYACIESDKLSIPELNLVIERQSVLKSFKLDDIGQTVEIRFRLDGRAENKQGHRLKRLFQSHKIAPWLRATTPQIYIDGDLMGLWL